MKRMSEKHWPSFAKSVRLMSNSSFEDILAKEGRLIYTCVGDSMRPLIRDESDLLVIERPSGRLKKYDVPLYRRDSGQYVLHRVLKVREKDYVICGDNRWQKETGITDRNIIGVLKAIVRDGKELSVTEMRYKLYVHIWCGMFPLRAFILRGFHFLKRLKKK